MKQILEGSLELVGNDTIKPYSGSDHRVVTEIYSGTKEPRYPAITIEVSTDIPRNAIVSAAITQLTVQEHDPNVERHPLKVSAERESERKLRVKLELPSGVAYRSAVLRWTVHLPA